MPNNIFKERLRRSMQSKCVRQVDIVAKAAICNYLAGRYEPTGDRMRVLADYLNVSPAWLAGYTDEADKAESHIEIRCDGNKTRVLVDGKEISGNIVHLAMEIVVQSDDEQ